MPQPNEIPVNNDILEKQKPLSNTDDTKDTEKRKQVIEKIGTLKDTFIEGQTDKKTDREGLQDRQDKRSSFYSAVEKIATESGIPQEQILAWVFENEIRAQIDILLQGDNRFNLGDIKKSSKTKAGEKVAAIKKILSYLGLDRDNLIDESSGQYGGPGGKVRKFGLSGLKGESDTRLAVRNLQNVLQNNIENAQRDPRFKLDGLFGERTLKYLQQFINLATEDEKKPEARSEAEQSLEPIDTTTHPWTAAEQVPFFKNSEGQLLDDFNHQNQYRVVGSDDTKAYIEYSSGTSIPEGVYIIDTSQAKVLEKRDYKDIDKKIEEYEQIIPAGQRFNFENLKQTRYARYTDHPKDFNFYSNNVIVNDAEKVSNQCRTLQKVIQLLQSNNAEEARSLYNKAFIFNPETQQETHTIFESRSNIYFENFINTILSQQEKDFLQQNNITTLQDLVNTGKLDE